MKAISIQNLTVDYGGQVLAVDDLSLEIPSGRFLAVVDSSGCGKTMLLNLLTGLVPLEKGKIDTGRMVADMMINLPRPRHVGALESDPTFLSHYSQVWEQLERGIEMSGSAAGEH
jgi:ABC-type Fe3+/spermidine/putrescine transport system ATPase subunit